MKIIISDKLARILKNKKRLENILNVKITNRGKEVFISGNPEEEYIGEKVIDAINFGFPFSIAILIKEEDFMFEIINVKNHTNRKDLSVIISRIIGKKGKAIKTLSQLTKCYIEIKDSCVGIIGPAENMKNTENAILYLIKGSKHSNVYSYLEKHQIEPVYDLGLKKKIK